MMESRQAMGFVLSHLSSRDLKKLADKGPLQECAMSRLPKKNSCCLPPCDRQGVWFRHRLQTAAERIRELGNAALRAHLLYDDYRGSGILIASPPRRFLPEALMNLIQQPAYKYEILIEE